MSVVLITIMRMECNMRNHKEAVCGKGKGIRPINNFNCSRQAVVKKGESNFLQPIFLQDAVSVTARGFPFNDIVLFCNYF